MWVDPAARGAGVGDALIQQVVEWASSADGTALVLSVREQNAHALALYRRAGFVLSDEATDDPSEIQMQRLLG
jgi:ribosomal protein S18 acetylase RimI-like enzyme